MNTLSFALTPNSEDAAYIDVFPVIDGKTVDATVFDFNALLAAEDLPFACFDIFTCSCGHAGCAGYFDPFIAATQPDAVTWYTTGQIANLLGAPILTFEPSAYKTALATLRADIARLHTEGKLFTILTDVDWDDDDEEAVIRLDPAEQEMLMRKWMADPERQDFAVRELADLASDN
jgi:hypothetical protein